MDDESGHRTESEGGDVTTGPKDVVNLVRAIICGNSHEAAVEVITQERKGCS